MMNILLPMWLPLRPDPTHTIRGDEVVRYTASQSDLNMNWWPGLTRILSYP